MEKTNHKRHESNQTNTRLTQISRPTNLRWNTSGQTIIIEIQGSFSMKNDKQASIRDDYDERAQKTTKTIDKPSNPTTLDSHN
jgi:glyceraldehyde-3-phosphate dehydrogenase/erythrose-4-phosphate dehydrogenase